ncbi:hypothetical protein OAU44_00140 [bacterium]|nr:hypothetical protein [bacterium]
MNPIFEAMSAMQKGIRRNEPETAYFFALVLERFNPIMLWNRLQIIVSEDIGRANPSLPTTFETLRKWYYDDLDKGGTGTLYLSHIITLMASGPKCRDADNIVTSVKERMHYEGDYMPVPDYAYDKHTLKGKKMGRGREHFWTEAAKLAEDNNNPDILANALKMVDKYPNADNTKHSAMVKSAWKRLRGAKAKSEPIQQSLDSDMTYNDSDNDRESDME